MRFAAKYAQGQIILHWLSVALILVMAFTGLAYSNKWISGAIGWHQIMGQVLIAVLVLRLVWKTRQRRSEADPTIHHPAWERVLARITHIGLYGTMIAFVITGYVAASGETDNALLAPVSLGFARSDTGETLLEYHYMLKWVLLGFVGLHIAGALKHAVVDRDDTLKLMTLNRQKD